MRKPWLAPRAFVALMLLAFSMPAFAGTALAGTALAADEGDAKVKLNFPESEIVTAAYAINQMGKSLRGLATPIETFARNRLQLQ